MNNSNQSGSDPQSDAMEETVHESLLAFIDQFAFGVTLSDANNKLLYANTAAWKLLGTGKSAPDDLHSLSFGPAWSAIKSALPGLLAQPGNDLTLCWVDRNKQLRELKAFMLQANAGPGRTLLVLSGEIDNKLASQQLGKAHRLTRREAQVLHVFANCCSIMEVSNSLSLDSNTVRAHMKAIYAKLRVGNQAELVKQVYEHPARLIAAKS